MASNTFGKRVKQTGKGGDHSFIKIPHYILKSSEFGRLSGNAVKLLFEVAKEYKGHNNGDFSIVFSQLRQRGWKSAGTLAKSKAELVNGGWLFPTRHGGSHRCGLYAVTWWAIDDCNKKLEVSGEKVARNSWKQNTLSSRYSDRSSHNSDSTGQNAPVL